MARASIQAMRSDIELQSVLRYRSFNFVLHRRGSPYSVVRRLHVTARLHHSGLLSFSANEENMMLKLMLILSSALMLVSTECSK
jgi:hypothetical protein